MQHGLFILLLFFSVKQLANKTPANLKKRGTGVISCPSGKKTEMNLIIFSVHAAPFSHLIAVISRNHFPPSNTCLCALVMPLWREIQPVIVQRPHWLELRPFRFKAKWQLLIVGKLITLHVLSCCIKQGAHVMFSIFWWFSSAQRGRSYRHVRALYFMIADKSLFIQMGLVPFLYIQLE